MPVTKININTNEIIVQSTGKRCEKKTSVRERMVHRISYGGLRHEIPTLTLSYANVTNASRNENSSV